MNLDLTAHVIRGEPVTFADAMKGSFRPFHVGDAWGPPWSTTWFHVRGQVPEEWNGRSVVAIFDLGFDGPTGFTCEALAWRDARPWRGVDPNHRWLPIDGRNVDFYLEAAANPRASESGAEPAASMIDLRTSPEPAFVLREAELALWDPPPDDGRRPDLGSHLITAIGHAHIDTAWEWPLREARRKCARSWSTQLALMDEHPDYVFACSQPAQYQWIKESYPHLYARIRQKVRAGQWEPVGAMWVEPDCNLPSGEALVRQLLHGQRFFRREFDRETRIAWLPDVFGYPGNLPQLLKEAGCDYFLTQKLSWNDTNQPEHHTFWWEGIDGTRIFTHFPPADTYNGLLTADELEWSARNFKDGESSDRSLYLFGYGDGGGGPTPEMIDSAHRFGVRMDSATRFFAEASTQAKDLATVSGELYFELHRGTYTTQSRTKRWNRIAQQTLREAEMWSVAAGGYPYEQLEALWKTVPLNQFHDILPGSSIDWVYEEAERDLERAVEQASEIADAAIATIAGSGGRRAFFNPTSHPRSEVGDMDGMAVRIEVPPCGWAVGVTRIRDEGVEVSERRMENELLRIEWDERAVLTSIWDKEAGREVLAGPGNLLQLHDDNPSRWDAWDLDAGYRDSHEDLVGDVYQVKTRAGAVGVLVYGRDFGSSKFVQLMSLESGSRVLKFQSQVDWRERHKLLKVAFPVTVSAREATYEIQFGHLRRPTHEDDSKARAMFEVCAQRWADLGDGDYGVALLNDCKHGYDIHGSVMRLSLLRSPTHPDPTADQGGHRFTYALMPHRGDFREAGVIEAAEDLNSPMRAVPADMPDGTRRALVEIDTRQVIVEAIKRAEDSDAVIVRLYEAWGRPCRARIRTTLPAGRAWLCDLLERNSTELAIRDGELELELSPFRILTLKLESPAG
ncbi:MAG TPA: alpha-mannosidase [Candidatus Sulfotelmatobacter sp.]|nr:alpha-mannosidase [Candidatus Sulfotelmatobacter sp.]